MKAILCKEWGPPETLVLEDVPAPSPGDGEVRIRVRACGVNFADTLMIAGRYQLKPRLPFSPGMEFAGEVAELGAGVTALEVGQRVAGFTSFGGFAEELVTAAEGLLPLPDAIDDQSAAVFLIAYGTAHLALTHRARLQAGETLLVHGAAGGVGLAAVEVGKILGATVIATASTAQKLALAQSYGADHLVNYREENFRDRVKEITGGRGADVIFDPVGGDVFDLSMRCIAWEGRLLVVGFAAGRIPQLAVNLALVKNCSVVGIFWGAYLQQDPATLRASLHTLLHWLAAKKLRPHISEIFSLRDAPNALQRMIDRTAMGRLVIKI